MFIPKFSSLRPCTKITEQDEKGFFCHEQVRGEFQDHMENFGKNVAHCIENRKMQGW